MLTILSVKPRLLLKQKLKKEINKIPINIFNITLNFQMWRVLQKQISTY